MSILPGEILRTASRIAVKRFLPFLGIGVAYFLPLLVLSLFLEDGFLLGDGAGLFVLVLLLHPVFFLAMAGPIVGAVVRELDGEEFSLSACTDEAVSRLLPVLGVILALALTFVGSTLAVGWIPFLVGEFLSWGLIAFLAVRWSVAVPAVVVERSGVRASLARSVELSVGHRWTLLVLGLLVFLLPPLVFSLLGRILDGALGPYSFQLIGFVVSAVLGVLHASVQAVAYYRLRQEKDGMSPKALADVFE